MWRVVTSTFAALTLFSTVAAAQQPCTSDANRVVAEVYRHTLERGADQGAQTWVRQLANGQLNVKEIVRRVAKSQEYMQRFGQTEPGEGQPYERAVSRLYRHILGRQPDANGLRNWARSAQQRGLPAVVDGLIDSAEYNNNFGEFEVPGSGGVTYCANNNGAGQSSSVEPRFRGLDDNGDGVISRAEWNGNNVSFNNQDSNGDGVISGQEMRAEGRRAGRRANGYDFDALDVNNNNRVERREWQARLEEFNRLNTNGDNFLTRDELEGVETAGTSGRAIAVGGDRQWVDTGIDVQAGDNVAINASGQIRVARDGGPMTAAGIDSGRTEGATIPNARVGGLVARFGNSPPVFIGESRTFRAPRAGRLYLGVNDNFFDDNTGQFNVTVDVN
jgi:Ca2+-binding EF-hand superfamily protein